MRNSRSELKWWAALCFVALLFPAVFANGVLTTFGELNFPIDNVLFSQAVFPKLEKTHAMLSTLSSVDEADSFSLFYANVFVFNMAVLVFCSTIVFTISLRELRKHECHDPRPRTSIASAPNARMWVVLASVLSVGVYVQFIGNTLYIPPPTISKARVISGQYDQIWFVLSLLNFALVVLMRLAFLRLTKNSNKHA